MLQRLVAPLRSRPSHHTSHQPSAQCACACLFLPAGTQCVSSETRLAMLRRKMEGGGRAAVEALRRQEQELLSLSQIEVPAAGGRCAGLDIHQRWAGGQAWALPLHRRVAWRFLASHSLAGH